MFLGVVVGVMIVAGSLGGLVNYFQAQKDDPESSSFWKSTTLGIAASLLVPLFLNMISSNLLDSIRTGGSDTPDFLRVLVFFGFCLVAAISSTAFIKTLSDRVLKEAKEAKDVARQADEKASEAKSAIQPIIEKETEGDQSTTDGATPSTASVSTVDENERKLLLEMANGKWALRTRSGLAVETGIPKPQVEFMVEELRDRGLVDFRWINDRLGKQRRRWYITENGRNAVA
jgi:hypothetical protein